MTFVLMVKMAYEMNVLQRYNVSKIASSGATRLICETAKQKQITPKTLASGAQCSDILLFSVGFYVFRLNCSLAEI